MRIKAKIGIFAWCYYTVAYILIVLFHVPAKIVVLSTVTFVIICGMGFAIILWINNLIEEHASSDFKYEINRRDNEFF